MEKQTVLIVCILLAFFGVSVSAEATKCENVTLLGNQLTTTCNITSAYENIKCQFTLQNGGIDIKNITDAAVYITYTAFKPEITLFYITSCTLLYPVNGLEPGNWTVKVIMYPVGSFNQGFPGQAANTLLLSVPTVYIDPNNCPKGLAGEDDTNVRDGYIRQGERASCLCTRGHAGNPPGTVEWSSTQRDNFDILSQNEYATTIQINSQNTFTCRSVSVLDGSHSMVYTPKYAYGPTNASVTIQPPEPFYLCPNQNIIITCQVPENSFNPGLLFTIREGRDYIVNKEPGDTAWCKSGNYSLTRSGHHTFQCGAENKIFRDISIVNRTNLHVYPHISITGTSVKTDENGTWVRPGSDITVKCLVGQKNDPHVNSINLKCGQKTSTNGTLSVTVSSDMTCQCDVEHNTTTFCNGHHLTASITIRTALSNRNLSELEDSFSTGAVVGGAVGGFVALAVVVVGVFFCVRRGKKKNANSSDERVYNNPTHDSTEVDNSDLYSPYEPRLNLYDEIDPKVLNRQEKVFATKPEAKATTEAKSNRIKGLKPNVKTKAKPKSPETDTKDHVTTEATGGPPLQSAHFYEEMELEDERKGPLAISERTKGRAQHSPNDDHKVYFNCPAKNKTDSLASNDVIAEGTEGPAQHSPNDEDEVYLNYKAKNEADYQNLRMT